MRTSRCETTDSMERVTRGHLIIGYYSTGNQSTWTRLGRMQTLESAFYRRLIGRVWTPVNAAGRNIFSRKIYNALQLFLARCCIGSAAVSPVVHLSHHTCNQRQLCPGCIASTNQQISRIIADVMTIGDATRRWSNRRIDKFVRPFHSLHTRSFAHPGESMRPKSWNSRRAFRIRNVTRGRWHGGRTPIGNSRKDSVPAEGRGSCVSSKSRKGRGESIAGRNATTGADSSRRLSVRFSDARRRDVYHFKREPESRIGCR